MSFTGGKLKLKGGGPLDKKHKKKKSKASTELALVAAEAGSGSGGDKTLAQSQVTREGYVIDQPDDNADRRTAAERKFDEIQAKREAEKIAKMATKSHRDRVNEFNQYLANLTEHHDIPRVGPG